MPLLKRNVSKVAPHQKPLLREKVRAYIELASSREGKDASRSMRMGDA